MTIPTWNIDLSHSSLGFAVRHLMFSKVRGSFGKWTATLAYDPKNPSATRLTARVETASINTNEDKRDAHLRSPDFFDVAAFPTMTFESKSVAEQRNGDLLVEGDLTLHGVTKPVTLTVETLGEGKDPWGNTRAGFHAKGKIDRTAFGLGWNVALEAGGVLVGTEIEITIDVEAIAQAKQVAAVQAA